MKIEKNYIVTAAIAVAVGVGGFVGGMQYQKMHPGNAQFTFTGQNGQQVQFTRGQGGQRAQGGGQAGQTQGARVFGQAGGGRVMGEILSADDQSITVKLQDGSSKIVLLSDKTSINKAAAGTKADLKVGEQVAAFGTTNTDGSVTAQSVQLNPMMGAVVMQGQPAPSASPATK